MFVSSSWSFILNIFSWNLTISITYWYPLINQLYYTSKIQVTSSTVHSFQPHWMAPEVLIYSDSEQSFASTVSMIISYIRRFSFGWFWIQVVLALLLMYGTWGVQLLKWQQQSHLGASIKGYVYDNMTFICLSISLLSLISRYAFHRLLQCSKLQTAMISRKFLLIFQRMHNFFWNFAYKETLLFKKIVDYALIRQ